MRKSGTARASAVVLAYHNVGVRCLKVLLAHEVDVRLVVTHDDDPGENIWFDSVAQTAAEYGIPVIAPTDVNTASVTSRIAGLKPDFLFSFYYRQMLKPALLTVPSWGALNMHGSLLPKYRGRAPVNWAVLHGERETGATLHYMTDKPDNGDIVAQRAVPILPDDTAREVFDKVTVAAELALDGVMPALLTGAAPRAPQDSAHASYFGGRKPADGIIDWSKDAHTIHNLVRAVAPPYPGAITDVAGVPARLLRTRVVPERSEPTLTPTLEIRDGRLLARCGGGGSLIVAALELDGVVVDAAAARARLGSSPALLGAPASYTSGRRA